MWVILGDQNSSPDAQCHPAIKCYLIVLCVVQVLAPALPGRSRGLKDSEAGGSGGRRVRTGGKWRAGALPVLPASLPGTCAVQLCEMLMNFCDCSLVQG